MAMSCTNALVLFAFLGGASLRTRPARATEWVEVTFSPEGINALAKIAADVNESVENIGARRLYTVIERVFEELSFMAPDKSGTSIEVNSEFVENNIGDLSKSADLSRYVL